MPRNGTGTYTLPAGNPVVTGTTISSTWANNTLSDIASALTQSVSKDGQTTITGNIPMGGFKLTGLGNGSAATDSATLGQAQAGTLSYIGTVGGTVDVITLTASPAITAYAAGQKFWFLSPGANTTNVTVNINSLGAKAVTKFGATALVANDMPASGVMVCIEYDGTQFQLQHFLVTGTSGHAVPLLDGANTHSAANTFSAGTGAIVMSSSSINEAKGSDIADSATPAIGAATGNFVDVNGTTTITAFDTVQAGVRRVVRFTGARTLTYNATSLILPGNANITTASGDIGVFISLGSGNWVCVDYVKRSGLPTIDNIGIKNVLSGSVSAQATCDIDFSTVTNANLWIVYDVVVANDAVRVDARTATVAAPTSFASAANSYQFIVTGQNSAGASISVNSTTATSIQLTGSGTVGNASTESFKGEMMLIGRSDSTKHKLIRFRSWWTDNSTNLVQSVGDSMRNTADPIGAIRLLASAGNITVTYNVYSLN